MTSRTVGAPSSARLLATVRVLAGDRFAGRRVGSDGGRAAGRWLAEQLREIGAVASLEEFTATDIRELYETPVLEWASDGPPVRLAHRRDFVVHGVSAELATPRSGNVVAAGSLDVTGHWVLADSAHLADVESYLSAAGLLVPRGTDDAGWMPKMISGPPVRDVPVLAVRAELHQRMSAGGVVSASSPVRAVTAPAANVHGVVREPRPDGMNVLLTGHYDGVGDDPEQRLPAAADNASGVAVVLEAARLLAADLPDVGLEVAFLDAEEVGAQGSAHHASHVRPGTWVINVDGAARLGETAAVEAGGPAHRLLAALDQAGRQTGVPLGAGAMPSDNRRYAAAGLPSIGIGMGMPGYQTPAETVDRVEKETLVAATDLVVATVRVLAGSASP